MKKIFSLFAAILFAGGLMAAEATYTFTDVKTPAEAEAAGFTITFDKGSGSTNPAWNATNSEARLYAKGSLTIDGGVNVITKIVFDYKVNANNKGVSPTIDGVAGQTNAGAWDAENKTWSDETGDSKIVFSTSGSAGNVGFKAITITYVAGETPKVLAPIIEGEEIFFDSTIVTMTCSTEDADIYYTIDGTTDPKCDCAAAPEYEKPIVIKETTTIKAAAYTGNDWSAVVEKTFTKAPSFASFEALVAAELADKTLVEVAFEGIKIDSIYVSSAGKRQGLYITVNEKVYEIYYNKAEVPAEWVAGGTVSGKIRGNWTLYKGLWEIVPSASDWAWALTYKAQEEPVIDPWAEIMFSAVTEKSEALKPFNDSVFTIEGSEFTVKAIDPDGKMATDGNVARFATDAESLDSVAYAYRLKSGGKSTSSKNYLVLNIPTDGMLRIAVRSSSATANNRNLVVAQGADTLYNAVVQDADTFKINGVKCFPYVYVSVKKGEARVSYPKDALNFYSLALLAEAPKPLEFAFNLSDKDAVLTITPSNNDPWAGMAIPQTVIKDNFGGDISAFAAVVADMMTTVTGEQKLPLDSLDKEEFPAGDYYFVAWGFVDDAVTAVDTIAFSLGKHPANCVEAKEAALSVAANNALYNYGMTYTIEGYVTEIQSSWSNKKMSFWIADSVGNEKVIEAYNCAIEKQEDAVYVGDKVKVTGKLTKYNTTPEFAAGCTVVIIEKGERPVPKNLGEKTIAEFLELKNKIDTCILTGVIDSVVNTEYGNFNIVDATGKVYVYGLLTAAGEAKKCFVEEGLAEGDTLTVLAIYGEYNNAPQVKNAIFVEVKKAAVSDTIALDFSEGSGWVSNEYFEEYGSTDLVLYNIPVVGGALAGDGDFLVLDFYPEDANDVSGTYTIADETLDDYYTYLMRVNGTDTTEVAFTAGELKLEVLQSSVEQSAAQIKVEALLVGGDNNIYTVTGTFVLYYDFLPEEEGIEDVIDNKNAAIKRIEKGQFIIEKNGVLYNATGARIR